MKPFRLVWSIHKWIGISLGLVLILSAGTGLLLLVKKDYAWLQPVSHRGAPGEPADYRPIADVYEAVFAMDLPQFRTEADIDRIDFRPGRRLHKVRSVHDDLEVQVDAITLQTWGPEVRRSDWLERLHDGSMFGDTVHGYAMPLAAILFVVLSVTGYLVWLMPIAIKRRQRKERAAGGRSASRIDAS